MTDFWKEHVEPMPSQECEGLTLENPEAIMAAIAKTLALPQGLLHDSSDFSLSAPTYVGFELAPAKYREKLNVAVLDYLDYLKDKTQLVDFSDVKTRCMVSSQIYKDTKSRKVNQHVAIITLNDGDVIHKTIKGMSWRRAKPKLARYCKKQAGIMYVDFKYQPIPPLPSIDGIVLDLVIHKDDEKDTENV